MSKFFFHPRANRKMERRSKLRRLFVTAVPVAALAVAIWTVDWAGVARLAADFRDSLLGHTYFSVREIKVSSGTRVGGSEIVTLAGLSHGMNIWRIDARAIERKVKEHPWVKQVIVRREFPHRVVIEVQERVPRAVLALEKLYYVDEDGVVFKEVGEGEQVDLPFLTGLKQDVFLSDARLARQKIEQALSMESFLRERSLSLSEISFSLGERVVLYPIGYPVPVTLAWDNWRDALERAQRVMLEWKGKENRLMGLDVSFRDRVVARVRTKMKVESEG